MPQLMSKLKEKDGQIQSVSRQIVECETKMDSLRQKLQDVAREREEVRGSLELRLRAGKDGEEGGMEEDLMRDSDFDFEAEEDDEEDDKTRAEAIEFQKRIEALREEARAFKKARRERAEAKRAASLPPAGAPATKKAAGVVGPGEAAPAPGGAPVAAEAAAASSACVQQQVATVAPNPIKEIQNARAGEIASAAVAAAKGVVASISKQRGRTGGRAAKPKAGAGA